MNEALLLTKTDDFFTEDTEWGDIETLEENDQFSVKIFNVNPFSEVSPKTFRYQSRLLRVLSGNPVIVINQESNEAHKGDKFHIPMRSEHQIVTHSKKAQILEIAFLW